MPSEADKQTDELLRKLANQYGLDTELHSHLRPVLLRIFGSKLNPRERIELLNLVVETYSGHLRIRKSIQELRGRVREKLNDIYSRVLGIEPPGLG